MINLLPIENKIKNKKNYLLRLLVVFGILISIIFASAVLLLLPLLFSVSFEEKSLARSLSIIKQNPRFTEKEMLYREAKNLNKKIANFNNGEKNIKKVSDLIGKILDKKPTGVSIISFSYNNEGDKESLNIEGEAVNRSLFLDFKNNLAQSEIFKEVNYPLADILNEKNLSFKISIDL